LKGRKKGGGGGRSGPRTSGPKGGDWVFLGLSGGKQTGVTEAPLKKYQEGTFAKKGKPEKKKKMQGDGGQPEIVGVSWDKRKKKAGGGGGDVVDNTTAEKIESDKKTQSKKGGKVELEKKSDR